MKKLLAVLTAVFVSLSMAQDLGGRTIVSAMDSTYPPFEFVDDSGELAGFDIDLMAAICERINCTVEYTPVAWDGMVAAMGAGNFEDFDMIIGGISVTDERDKTIDYSTPYLTVNQAITVRVENEDYTIDSFTADSGLKLGAQIGTTNADLAVELVGEGNTTTYDTFQDAILALLQGDIDGVTIDGVTADAFAEQYAGELVVDIRGLSNDPLAIVFQEGDELIDAFDGALAQLEEDGTLAELVAKWFDQ